MPLFSWLYNRMTARPQTRCTSAPRPAPRFRPQMEILEGRDLPSFSAPVSYPVGFRLCLVNHEPSQSTIIPRWSMPRKCSPSFS